MTKPRDANQILDSLVKTLQHTPGLDLTPPGVLKSILGAVALELEHTEQWLGRLINDLNTYSGIDRSVDPNSILLEKLKQQPSREPSEAPWGTTTEGENNDNESNDT